MDYKMKISELLSRYIDLTPDEISKAVEVPGDAKMGDYAYPCFKLSKLQKIAPQAIAAELAEKISAPEYISEIRQAGPYLNFFMDKPFFAESVLCDIYAKGITYGSSDVGRGKTVVFDYSSPQIAKRLHIGHLYTTVIGGALYKIYSFLGYKTVGINFLGDWGTPIGKTIVAYNLWSDEETLKEKGLAELDRLYVKFHAEAENDPHLEDEARACVVKMQNGNKDILKIWDRIREISIQENEKLYKRLNIEFDSYRGESWYNDKMDVIVEEMREKNLLVKSDGAMIVDLEEYKMPPCLILRSDGGTLYPTRDIASAFDRKTLYDFHKAVYITDLRQSMHFAQWFKVIELMGYEWAKDLIHLPYGSLSFDGVIFSSRRGSVILLEDLFNEATERVLKLVEEKNPSLENKDFVSEQVGIGAIVFSTLFNNRIKDVVFSWDRMLNFDGETGPYVQYTHARCSGVLEKSGGLDFSGANLRLLDDNESFEVIKLLYTFPEKILEAAEKFEPFVISRALIDISSAFNKFYHNNNILNSGDELKQARLYLVKCVKDVLFRGLSLIGISAPEKM